MTKLTRPKKRLLATVLIAVVAWAWGGMLLQSNSGTGLRNASYDLPFLFGEDTPPDAIVLIYLDEFSHDQLKQPLAERWDRRLHAQLVDHLAKAGARTIVFDILFYDAFPEEDARLAEAMKAHGEVLLAGELERGESANAEHERLLLATPDLRRAASGWGLTFVQPDPDGRVRHLRHQLATDFGPKPSLSAKTAAIQVPSLPIPETSILLNYYGRPGAFSGYSYSDVLQELGVPPDAFRDKIVIIGARQQAGLADAGKDTFATPYTALTRELSPGMDIHATALANLLNEDTMSTASAATNRTLLALAALALALATCMLSPTRGVPLAILLALGIAVLGYFVHRSGHVLVLWTIPALAQAPLVIALGLGAHYLIEYSARWKLRRAFKSYMSDEQARQIDEDAVSLKLGGKEVDATILFSDLAGFTAMSEGLPPQSVSKALITYFESATAGILDNKGTIIKYVGDAVMATWGAPLKVDHETDRAIDAAIQMQVAGRRPITLETESGSREQVLETRVGINSGPGLAGNLGSKRRFDYSVIGDTTNTAARLEGLNKMLGTSILVSEAALNKCDQSERFAIRCMGSFILKGKKQGLVVHEVLGYAGQRSIRERSDEYLHHYQAGLDAFQSARWDQAREQLTLALKLHDRLPEDPASRLLLDTLDTFGDHPPDASTWRGEITLQSK